MPRLSFATALPSSPMMSAPLTSSGATVPPAASTSGSARISSTSPAGTVTPLPLVDPWTISFPPMTASVLSSEALNRPLNDFCMVSVSTNVPATIDTPMTTASAVSSARTLRPASPFKATPIIGSSPPRAC